MIDFHSHILPGMDDGSSCVEESAAMLEMSARQGVNHIFATSHFYADEEDPVSFLRRRKKAWEELTEFIEEGESYQSLPKIHLGAEVYYFPGISSCEEIIPLAMEDTGHILIEPPFRPFSSAMLEEISEVQRNLGLKPVIAHLDRYCRMLQDNSLFARMTELDIAVQVNASFFLRPETTEFAVEMMNRRLFQYLGSDCHNMTDRTPNLGWAVEIIKRKNCEKYLAMLDESSYNMLKM